MWKFQMGLATLCMSFQWVMFSLNLIHNGHFNKTIFVLAIGWTIWTSYCYYKLKIQKNGQ